ncbi:MAG: hypothetical protein LAP39_29520 [Acidobacteriia bacterium]|nr:hypothetical protein [Terriglobia bacterium]
MLANVLQSPVAVRASIQVVRAFVHLRQMLAGYDELARRIEALERKMGKHDAKGENGTAKTGRAKTGRRKRDRRIFGRKRDRKL